MKLTSLHYFYIFQQNLRLRWPQYFNWLLKFKVGRRKCVICGEFEGFKMTRLNRLNCIDNPKFIFIHIDSKFTICKNLKCGVSYCNDCWNDMGNMCLVCNDVVSIEVVLNFNDFFEEFSFA